MRFLRQSIVGLFLVAATLAVLIYAAQIVRGAISERMAESARVPMAKERVFAVAVTRAELQTATPVMEAYGELRAKRSLELRAAAAGRVIALHDAFVEGGTVRKGEVLLRLDPADAQAVLARANADLADAEAEIREARAGLALAKDELTSARDQAALQERALERAGDLQSRGVGTAAAVEAAELAAASSRASVLNRRQALANAEARIDQSGTRLTRVRIAVSEAERDVEDTVLSAPFDGVLSDVKVVEGGLLAPNEHLADLVDPSALDVAFRLSAAQYARLLDDAGTLAELPIAARLEVSGIRLEASGRISRDSATTGEAQTGRLIFAALEAERGFKPGDFVTVSVQEPPIENVVRLPAAALDGSDTVLVLGPEDRLESLRVLLVRRQGNDVLVQGYGLSGREVVTARSPLLGPGISVRPLRPERGNAPEEPEMVELSEERRARLVAFVQSNARIPKEIKTRVLDRLKNEKVPAHMIERIESRMGG